MDRNTKFKREREIAMGSKNINKNFLKDVMNEQAFEEMLTVEDKGKLTDRKTELELMTKVLNEQTESMVRYRFDVEFWREKERLNPADEEARTKSKEADNILESLRITVRIIREHIAKKLGKIEITDKN